PEGQAIFARYRYFATPEEAFAWLGEEKPVGGEYQVPAEWLGR
ncbi:MAG TPA: molybdate ABC transporter substrate-binding protein, partial [Gammaproteobacteria bacterium]|nr:molybdate ABC transporter substrate-binding protein [Gammaproteobacteria bacterium]